MLRAVIICPEKELGDHLEDALYEAGRVVLLRRLDHYPDGEELARFLRVHAPEVAFLSVESVQAAQALAPAMEAQIPGLQVVAVSRVCEPQMLLDLMRSGIREFLAAPFEPSAVRLAIDRISEQLQKKPVAIDRTNLVFSFLPSKAGVGTSTIAANTAGAFAREPGNRTLLADFDLNSGIIRFLLKIDNQRCILDAAGLAAQMDDTVWPQVVTSFQQMDVIHAGSMNPGYRFESSQIRQLLEFARRSYKAVCVDLSGNMEKYSIELMQESKRIFLVTTQEITALHLAREKLAFLRTLDLEDRVTVVLNRYHKRGGLPQQQVEELLGLPVHLSIPNDYQGVLKALTLGKLIEPSSELGRKYTALAQTFTGAITKPTPAKRSFVEYFSITPARYKLAK
ncbi:MAG: hypothetical protein ABI693_13670 [Bryobacteraceae bacterium]